MERKQGEVLQINLAGAKPIAREAKPVGLCEVMGRISLYCRPADFREIRRTLFLVSPAHRRVC
jgi:hypothetical protein